MMDFSQISSIDWHINTMVMLSLYFVLAAYTIFTAILYYHWKTYGTDNKVTGLTLILYFSTTIPLLLAMGITAMIII